MADLFSVTMTGDQEVPPTGSTAFGYGSVAWDAAAGAATYHLVVYGLDFASILETGAGQAPHDAINMHVHTAEPGVAGPVVFGQITPRSDPDDLYIFRNDDGSWTVGGVWEPTDPAVVSIAEFADRLTAAREYDLMPLYFNVHSPAFPGGEIRGQWVAATPGDTAAGGAPADATEDGPPADDATGAVPAAEGTDPPADVLLL